MSVLHIAICDDVTSDQRAIKKIIEQYCQDGFPVEIQVYSDGKELLYAYERGERFDLVFLDIKMSKVDGFKVAETIRIVDRNVKLIFVTGVFSSVLFEGFQHEVNGYIRKPVKKEKVIPFLAKAYELLREKEGRIIIVHTRKTIKELMVDDILYVTMASFRTVDYVYNSGRNLENGEMNTESIEEYNSLEKVFEKLSEKHNDFLPLSRSTIASAAYIIEFDGDKKTVRMRNNVTLEVSKKRWEKVKTDWLAHKKRIIEMHRVNQQT